MFKGGDISGGLAQIVKSLDCDYVRVPAFRGLRSYYSLAISNDPENVTLIYDWALILAKINRTEEAINRLHSIVGYAWSKVTFYSYLILFPTLIFPFFHIERRSQDGR